MPHVLSALVLLALTVAAAEIGFRLARKGATETGAEAGLSAAQSGILILASLLLAFTFGFAGSRYDLRRQLVVREANAIETAYLRCALLAAADSARLQRDLAAYTEARLRAYATTDTAVHSAADTTALRLQNGLWNDFTRRTRQSRTPPTIIVAAASAFNNVFDDAAAQRDAYNDRTPIPILVLLFVAVPLAGAVIGVGFGRGGAHHLALSATFAALAALTVFTILDLDDPQQGFIGNDVSAIRALGLTGSH